MHFNYFCILLYIWHVEFHVFKMVDPRSYGLQIEKCIELWTNKKKQVTVSLSNQKDTETIYFNSIRIISLYK